jgi:hypothetical protein
MKLGLTGVVAEELAQLKHVGAQNLRLHVGLGPEGVEEFVVGDETAGILDEVAQDRERLGRESHCDADCGADTDSPCRA